MNLDKINQWLVLVSNLGVLAGIVFLAIEINQNTTVARSSTRQAIAEMVSSRPILAYTNTDAARLSLKVFTDQPLTDVERIQAMSRWYSVMRDWENIHYQYQSGMLTEDEWRGFRLNLKSLFDLPILREYWANEHQFFSQRFQDEATAILEEKEREGPGASYDYLLEKKSDERQ
jgi:hypothetical protein